MIKDRFHFGTFRLSASLDGIPSWGLNGLVSSWCSSWSPTIPNYGMPEGRAVHYHLGQGEVVSPPLSFGDVFRLPFSAIEHEREYEMGCPPVQSSEAFRGDVARTTAMFQNAKTLFATTDWEKLSSMSKSQIDREKPVDHTTIRGEVISGACVAPIRPMVNGQYTPYGSGEHPQRNIIVSSVPPGIPEYSLEQVTVGTPYVSGYSTDQAFRIGYAGGERHPYWYIHSAEDATQSYSWGYPLYTGQGTTETNFVLSKLDPLSISAITWDCFHFNYDSTYYYVRTFAGAIRIVWSIISSRPQLTYDTAFPISQFVRCNITYESKLVYNARTKISTGVTENRPWGSFLPGDVLSYSWDAPVFGFSKPEGSDAQGVHDATRRWWSVDDLCSSSVNDDGKTLQPAKNFLSGTHELVKQFKRAHDADGSGLYALAVPAAYDAVAKGLGDLEMNNIENITQLSGISDIIKEPLSWINLAGKVSSSTGLRSLTLLLEILTSAQLLYSYGIAPTVSDAEEIAAKGHLLKSSIMRKRLLNWKEWHGSADRELPTGDVVPPYEGRRLVARATVVCRVRPESILASLLPYWALGLVPCLNKMWDLLPFSFVADWFFDISSKLEAIDRTFVNAVFIEVRSTTLSAKAIWPIPESELHKRGLLLGEAGENVELSAYKRGVFDAIPVITYSGYDRSPIALPKDWKTAGSLLFQVSKR